MKIIQYIYKTKTLAHNGKFLLTALVITLVMGILFIPKFSVTEINEQIFDVNGNKLKYNDEASVEHFFKSIKQNNGYLCLGTSESAEHLPEGNYYSFLENDSSISPSFSLLAGAGRTCGLYAPIFLNHQTAVKDLKIIYFINPVYWRENLATINKTYWNRYSSYGLCKSVDWDDSINKKYAQDVIQYYDQLNFAEKFTQQTEYYIRKLRSLFFIDFNYWLYPEKYPNEFTYTRHRKRDILTFKNFGEFDADIDTAWNVKKGLETTAWKQPINENVTYRYDELTSFIHLCKELNIESIFILGPYNEKFMMKKDSASVPGYKHVVDSIRNILVHERVNFIDESYITHLTGTFVDFQHHSSYGAYLIYQDIKKYLNEKENH